jgi:hypothetical protein
MRTLDHWESRLTAIPGIIECSMMHLIGRDHESPIFVGPGRIDVGSSTAIDFTMYASPTDEQDAILRLKRARENPYDIRDQFRLIATDYEDIEWSCGWTLPQLKEVTSKGWPLTGRLNSLVTQASGPWVSSDSGVELVFHPKLWLPMDKKMTSITSLDGVEVERRHRAGQHTVEVLESEIKFFYKPSGESLWVTARTSEKLTHPFAENWISEPLRVLLGQLIFPRLVARNFGNGTAQVWLRPSPRRFNNSGIASLLRVDPFQSPAKFWKLYTNLLKLVVEARDDQGQPNFESHPITRFYEEIAQATQGSRWVLCMTLASTGEGLARMLMRPDERKLDFPEKDIKDLKKVIEAWKGNPDLGKRVLTLFTFVGERGVASYLRDLVKRGVLTKSNAQAWSDVRNAVMHGSLVSPWATEEEDKRIIALADLVHRLTQELIGEHAKVKEDVPTSNEAALPTAIPAPSAESSLDESDQE